jgi:para-aminobenzoate synthetase component 1
LKRNSKKFTEIDIKLFKEKIILFSKENTCSIVLNSNNTSSTYDLVFAYGVNSHISSSMNSLQKLDSFISKTNDWIFGFLSYELKNEIENLISKNIINHNIPNLYFFQPNTVVLVKDNVINLLCLPNNDPDTEFHKIINYTSNNESSVKKYNLYQRFSKIEYIKTVNKIKERIRLGDIYELNFCIDYFSDNSIINPFKSYKYLNSLTESPMSVFFKFKSLYLISSSPERFVKKIGNKIITEPIKGTIRRLKNLKEDLKNINYLKNNSKELSENHMIVDLVRNDLSKIAKKGSVKVKELSNLYSFKNVHQLISTVEAKINNSLKLSEILKSSFPMGSMTGAPKIRSMQFIEEFEKTQRGIYSGSIGYISPKKDFDFNVVIRSIIYNSNKKNLNINVGSAITFASDPEKEYEECKLKAEAMINSLL